MSDLFTSSGKSSSSSSSMGGSSSSSMGGSSSSSMTNSSASDTSCALSGVSCDVVSCRHHNPQNQCCATSITVKAPDANSKDETFCATYAQNSGY